MGPESPFADTAASKGRQEVTFRGQRHAMTRQEFLKTAISDTTERRGARNGTWPPHIRILSKSITAGQRRTTGFVVWRRISQSQSGPTKGPAMLTNDEWPRSARAQTSPTRAPPLNRPAAPAVYGRFSPTPGQQLMRKGEPFYPPPPPFVYHKVKRPTIPVSLVLFL